MSKKFKIFFWSAIVFQLLTGAIHAISLFVKQAPENDTEKQMLDLMQGYHMPDGMGFEPTFMSLFTALSACFSLLCFLAGWINIYLYRNGAPANMLKGLMGIGIIIFGICFGLMAAFTFLPPVVCTGLIFISCAAAYFSAGRPLRA